MKSVRVHEHGGPEVMRVEDLASPVPGDGQVRVRVEAIGVNYIDTYFRAGTYKPPELPFTPGAEAAGRVAAVGPGVFGVEEGDRVAFVGALGCYAEELVVPAARLVPIADGISFETAAAMMLKGLTAQYLLRQTHKVQPGETILVHAAAGGVGLLLCQWGRHLGARVIGTAGTAEKAELARANGADEVILYRDEDFVARVRDLTDGKGCDVIYDGVGKATFARSLDCARPLGLVVSFGSASGPVDAFDLSVLAPKGSLFVTRPTLATYTADPANLAAMAQELMAVVSSGIVSIKIGRRARLDEVVAVHRALEQRETTGSTILTP